MRIFGYLKDFSHLSFDEMEFNKLDALVLSQITYASFEKFFDDGKTSIRLGDIDGERLAAKGAFISSLDAFKNKRMIREMAASRRYKNIIIRDCEDHFSHHEENQFYAVTYQINDDFAVIAFRGTDMTLAGWKEDCLLAIYDQVKAQAQADEYVANKALKNYKGKFIITGHSKGGNLSFYSALTLDKKHLPNLICAYSFDGPGFKDGIKNFPNYEEVKDRLIKFITYNNIIGSIFEDVDNPKIVFSAGVLGGHLLYDWQMSKKNVDFRYARNVSLPSRISREKFTLWVSSLTTKEKLVTIDAFFKIFGDNETVYELFTNGLNNFKNAYRAIKSYSKEEQEILKRTFKTLFLFIVNEKKMRLLNASSERKDALDPDDKDDGEE